MNEKNLKPLNIRTKSEQREIAKKGGIKSGEIRRERKKLKEDLELALSIQLNEEKQSEQELIIVALIKEAKKGSVAAFNAIRDLLGEKPIDKKEITGADSEPCVRTVYVTPEEVEAAEKHICEVIGEPYVKKVRITPEQKEAAMEYIKDVTHTYFMTEQHLK